MVRLKADYDTSVQGSHIISIPYGAIKRESRRQVCPVQVIFQFHMVRLKEDNPEAYVTAQPKFQFHMVRLKVVHR